jgi:BsuBI/PstI restriction endonuclease domain
LNAKLARLIESQPGPERVELIESLRLTGRRGKRARSKEGAVVVRLSGDRTFTLSPGPHNELERAVVETLAPAILARPVVVYLGDTALRAGYQDRALMRQINLPIDVTESLPDVVVYSAEDRHLLIVEVVTSTGPITPARLGQLRKLSEGPARLGIRIELLTAFPSRKELRRFVADIAWETSVWIAGEPWNVIHFVALDHSRQSPDPP